MAGMKLVGDYWRSEAKPRIVLSPRRSPAEQRGPLSACAGCGRPTRGRVCRGCDPKKGRL